ncbi:MAG: hypothetical protein R2855_12075 [Thermomicrobiales bacterium]
MLTTRDPTDTIEKKLKNNLYRLRAGNYRIYYSMVDDAVDILGVGPRKDVYRKTDRLGKPQATPIRGGVSLEELAAFDDDEDEGVASAFESPVSFSHQIGTSHLNQEKELLPRELDESLLEALRVPSGYWSILCACKTVDQLLDSQVPGDVLDPDHICDHRVRSRFPADPAPKYLVDSVADLLYSDDFDQIGMLLQLDPEQQKYVNWAISGNGPVLLR